VSNCASLSGDNRIRCRRRRRWRVHWVHMPSLIFSAVGALAARFADAFARGPARLLCSLLLACGVASAADAPAGSATPPQTAVRFGILPIGGALESRKDWEPLLAELAQALGRPVQMLSVNSYAALERAIASDEIDLAVLSGKMALDAVLQQRL